MPSNFPLGNHQQNYESTDVSFIFTASIKITNNIYTFFVLDFRIKTNS
jgi:hypothetical protein